jgi:hypothetical protein
VPLEGEQHAIGDSKRAEHSPPRQQTNLPRRQQFFRRIADLIVKQNVTMNHDLIVTPEGEAAVPNT